MFLDLRIVFSFSHPTDPKAKGFHRVLRFYFNVSKVTHQRILREENLLIDYLIHDIILLGLWDVTAGTDL